MSGCRCCGNGSTAGLLTTLPLPPVQPMRTDFTKINPRETWKIPVHPIAVTRKSLTGVGKYLFFLMLISWNTMHCYTSDRKVRLWIIWHFDQIHTRTVRECDFDFLTEWCYPVFRKTIFYRSIHRSVNTLITWSRYWRVNRWTGQYPILAYTTWRDLNQSLLHISLSRITNKI